MSLRKAPANAPHLLFYVYVPAAAVTVAVTLARVAGADEKQPVSVGLHVARSGMLQMKAAMENVSSALRHHHHHHFKQNKIILFFILFSFSVEVI